MNDGKGKETEGKKVISKKRTRRGDRPAELLKKNKELEKGREEKERPLFTDAALLGNGRQTPSRSLRGGNKVTPCQSRGARIKRKESQFKNRSSYYLKERGRFAA